MVYGKLSKSPYNADYLKDQWCTQDLYVIVCSPSYTVIAIYIINFSDQFNGMSIFSTAKLKLALNNHSATMLFIHEA